MHFSLLGFEREKMSFYKKIVSFFSLGTLALAFLTMPFAPRIVQAAECVYNLSEFRASQSNITQTGTAQLSAKVAVSGDVTKCVQQLKFTYYLRQNAFVTSEGNSYYDSNKTEDVFIGEQAVSISNLQAQSNFSYALSRIGADWKDKIPDPDSSLVFSLKVEEIVSWGLDRDILDSKPSLTVNVSGMSTGTTPAGGYKLNLDVQPSKGVYTPDDQSISVGFVLSSSDASNITSDVDVETKVGSTVVGGYQITRNNLNVRNVQTIRLPGNTAFKDGANTIIVTMTVADSPSAVVASGSINVQGTGFGGAGTPPGGDPTAGGGGDPTAGGGGVNLSPTDKLYNPLPTGDLINMVLIIAKGFLTVTAVIAVAFIMIGGFQMIISRGEEEVQVKAKKTITWAILGVVVASLSFSIVAIVENLLRAGVKTI